MNMTTRIFLADPIVHTPQIREIFWEYLESVNSEIYAAYQINFDIRAVIEQNMRELDKFMPPPGRLLLCYPEERPAGVACLKQLSRSTGEIKRMYVRPEYRRQGLGQALLSKLLEEATQIGYEHIRLDSARFMHAAHQLYRSNGFTEIPPYEESEIPREYWEHWVFMQR